MLRLVVSLLTLSLLCVSTPVAAQDDGDKERAIALAQEGGQAFQSGDYVLAAQKFAEAHEYYDDPNLKLNEMAAWYKAQRCNEAIAVAKSITASGREPTAQDKKDLYKVHNECGYKEAQRMLDAGDLDGAEAQLEDVNPYNPQLASAIGELRGKIAERRRTLAEQDANANNQTDPDISEKAQPLRPPPEWMRIAGLGGMGVGATTVVVGLLKFALIDNRAVDRWKSYFQDTYGCELDGENNLDTRECSRPAEADSDYDDFVDDLKAAQRANVALYIAGGSVAAVGAGLFAYYFIKKTQYEKAQSSESVTLSPVIAPKYAGFSLQLRF